MKLLAKSIALIGFGATLALAVPVAAQAGGPPHARDYGHYGHPGRHYGHERHWRHHHRHWHHRHRPHVVERVIYEPAPAASSEPSIVISPNIQLGGSGGYSDGGAPSSTLGTVVGAVAGAAIGSRIGKGRGNTAAIAIGSVVGGHIGGRVGVQ